MVARPGGNVRPLPHQDQIQAPQGARARLTRTGTTAEGLALYACGRCINTGSVTATAEGGFMYDPHSRTVICRACWTAYPDPAEDSQGGLF